MEDNKRDNRFEDAEINRILTDSHVIAMTAKTVTMATATHANTGALMPMIILDSKK